MPRVKTNKQKIGAELLELIGDGIEIKKTGENGLTTGERYTVVNGDRILIQALGIFSGSHKTVDFNGMSVTRLQKLTEIIKNKGGEHGGNN